MNLRWYIQNGLDEISAFILICSGIAYAFKYNLQDGLSLIGIGSSYLFGKAMPKKE